MKIAILTHPLNYNYGCILQNYALQHQLKQMGHEPYTLLYTDGETTLTYCRKHIRSHIRKLVGRKTVQHPITHTQQQQILQHITPFIDTHISIVGPYSKLTNHIQATHHFDAYIVGSDQVWHPHAFKRIEPFYLDFTTNQHVIRLAYAASFGVDEWLYTPEQTRICSQLAGTFNGLSVREKSGVTLARKYLNVDAHQLIDPTLLLDSADYQTLIPPNTPFETQPYLAVYVLDATPETQKMAQSIAHHLSLKIVYMNNPLIENASKTPSERIMPPIEHWLSHLSHANYVLTDSYHGTVFSILFQKTFLTLGNQKRGQTRFTSLLDTFQLKERWIDTTYTHTQIQKMMESPIDYTHVNTLLAEERQQALHFLERYL